MNKIYLFLSGLLGVVWVYFKGKNEGKKQETAKQNDEIIKKVKNKVKIQSDIGNTSVDKLHYRD